MPPPVAGIVHDGHSTIVDFSLDETISFVEVSVRPPGLQGGGANDATNMRTTRWRTNFAKKLLTATPAEIMVQYNPVIYETIIAMFQINQKMTITMPDLSKVDVWGWIDEFTPDTNVEGKTPTGKIMFIPSNLDDTESEVGPLYTPAA